MASKLVTELKSFGRAAIAFSGGCDSTLLAEAARRTLGSGNVLLLLADSVFLPRVEFDRAVSWSAAAGMRLEIVRFEPLESSEVRSNPPERCYFCKRKIFSALLERAHSEGFAELCDGTNQDDLGDFRPGMRAAAELGIRHPLLAAGLNKAAVRALAREYGLAVWNLPAAACLASRIPCGEALSAMALRQVEEAEAAIAHLGFTGFRVRRLSAEHARLEVAESDLERANSPEVGDALRRARFASWEIAPYRTGSMNQAAAIR